MEIPNALKTPISAFANSAHSFIPKILGSSGEVNGIPLQHFPAPAGEPDFLYGDALMSACPLPHIAEQVLESARTK